MMFMFRGIEIDLSKCDFIEGKATVMITYDEGFCIYEENATPEELELIQAIKDDVASRPVPEVLHIVHTPTDIEKLRADIDYLLMLNGEV